jgi:hypothetical protein
LYFHTGKLPVLQGIHPEADKSEKYFGRRKDPRCAEAMD